MSLTVLSDKCVLCDGRLESVIHLPNLPLTGIYSKNGQDKKFKDFDQELLLCTDCGHAQLKNMIDSSNLYGNEYGFRTSKSLTAMRGSDYFVSYLERLFPGKTFDRIIDFGCNDGYLLKKLKHKGIKLLGVDLIWKGCESDFIDEKIIMRGDKVENIDFNEEMGGNPDLILSQHTMEHVDHPKELLENLFAIASEDTVFIFEFPCFDVLMEHCRFDQVFHQHVQYYSIHSLLSLLERLKAKVIDFKINYSYWGAMIIAFKKGVGQERKIDDNLLRRSRRIGVDVIRRYDYFCQQIKYASFSLESLCHEKWYGYGAALMLSILAYHLKTDFSNFQSILDDDPSKDGLGYINLPVMIRNPFDIDYSDACFLLTALDNRRPILKKLIEKTPKRILNPLAII